MDWDTYWLARQLIAERGLGRRLRDAEAEEDRAFRAAIEATGAA